MNLLEWVTCLLALIAVVLSVFILVKVNKKCKQTYLPPNKAALRSRVNKVKMNNPIAIAELAQERCGDVGNLVPKFLSVMDMENRCQRSLWDDGAVPGLTDDDNVMMALCPDESGLTMSNFPQYQSQFNSVKCALEPPNEDVSQCCS